MEIALLTQEDCGSCHQAEEVLERLSTEYGFSVRTLDLASPEGLSLAEGGAVPFPPGVFIDGRPFSYGRLSERKLRRELDRRLGTIRKV